MRVRGRGHFSHSAASMRVTQVVLYASIVAKFTLTSHASRCFQQSLDIIHSTICSTFEKSQAVSAFLQQQHKMFLEVAHGALYASIVAKFALSFTSTQSTVDAQLKVYCIPFHAPSRRTPFIADKADITFLFWMQQLALALRCSTE